MADPDLRPLNFQPMKKLTALSLLAAALFFFNEKMAAQSNFHAFLIGIGDYPAEGGWKRINAVNDLDVIKKTLEQRGVPASNIATLVNGDATRAGILDAFKHDFLEKLNWGDVAYFQFSGHGQQVSDEPNGDEMDGFDEAIVPFDSPMRFEPGVNEGKKLVRDDELSEIFTQIRRKIGPSGNLIVVLDACHSGTGTRGMDIARGTDVIMASPDYVASAMARQSGSSRGYDPFSTGAPSSELAPMASFFGSAQNQLNFETRDENGRGIGSLTYALAKKLNTASPDQTYRGLFEQIKIEMSAIAPRQQPQAEGMLDQEIFGGNMREVAHFFHVTRWNDPSSVAIDAGSIFGLNDGSKVGFFAPETRDPLSARPIATGIVEGAQAFEATIRLDQNLSETEAKSAWVYVLEQNFGPLKIGVSVDLPQNEDVRAAFFEKIGSVPVIETASKKPEIFISEKNGRLEIWNAQDVLLDEISAGDPDRAAEAIVRRILGYVQAKFLRKMDSQSPLVDVSMEIFPVLLDKKTWIEKPIPAAQKRDGAGNFHAKEGDVLKIRLTNRGSKAAYFTLLDIQPDNKLNILVPDVGQAPSEFRIGAGETIEVAQRFEIAPPAGTEVFKLIATEQPIDLRPIAASRGETGQKAVSSPFEMLFSETFGGEKVQSRGGRTLNLAAGSIHVASSTFIID